MKTEKHCKRCDTTKPASEWPKSKSSPDGLHSYCTPCTREYQRSRYVPTGDIQEVGSCIDCGAEMRWKRKASARRNGRCQSCYHKYRTVYSMWHSAKTRAAQKDREFTLTIDSLYDKIIGSGCDRTGLPFHLEDTNKKTRCHPLSPSLDRIDPFKGYTEENTQVVCWWYNAAKNQFTDEEVIELCKAVAKRHS